MATPSETKTTAFEDYLMKQVKDLEKQLKKKGDRNEEMRQIESKVLMLNMTIPTITARLRDIVDKKCSDPVEVAKELLILIEKAESNIK